METTTTNTKAEMGRTVFIEDQARKKFDKWIHEKGINQEMTTSQFGIECNNDTEAKSIQKMLATSTMLIIGESVATQTENDSLKTLAELGNISFMIGYQEEIEKNSADRVFVAVVAKKNAQPEKVKIAVNQLISKSNQIAETYNGSKLPLFK